MDFMINQNKLIVLIDACVLYKANVRDLILRIASRKLFQARWNNEICNEFTRNLINKGKMTSEQANYLLDRMRISFPDAFLNNNTDLNTVSSLNLTGINQKDIHIVEAAIISKSQIIITNNLKHFPSSILNKYNIKAQSPDDFLQDLFNLSPEIVIDAFIDIEKTLINPPIPRNRILDGFMREVPFFTEKLIKQLQCHKN